MPNTSDTLDDWIILHFSIPPKIKAQPALSAPAQRALKEYLSVLYEEICLHWPNVYNSKSAENHKRDKMRLPNEAHLLIKTGYCRFNVNYSFHNLLAVCFELNLPDTDVFYPICPSKSKNRTFSG